MPADNSKQRLLMAEVGNIIKNRHDDQQAQIWYENIQQSSLQPRDLRGVGIPRSFSNSNPKDKNGRPLLYYDKVESV